MISQRYALNGKIPWSLNPVQKQYREKLIKLLNEQKGLLAEIKECYCRSRSFEQLTEKDRFGLPIGTVICRDCGLILSNPRLSEEFLPKFYKEFYYPLILGREGDDVPLDLVNPQQGYNIFKFCEFELLKLAKKKGLLEIGEIGCASGNNLFQIATALKNAGYSCRTSGCDYAEYYTDYTKKGFIIDYHIGGPEVLIRANKKFNFLILSHVLEHMVDLNEAKKNISELLLNDGLVYIEVPGILDLKNKYVYDCDLLKYLVLAHIYSFSLTTLRNSMAPEFDLIKGDEYCRALFKPSKNSGGGKINDYSQIMAYLEDLETNRQQYLSINPDRKIAVRMKRKIKTFAGRIFK